MGRFVYTKLIPYGTDTPAVFKSVLHEAAPYTFSIYYGERNILIKYPSEKFLSLLAGYFIFYIDNFMQRIVYYTYIVNKI